MAESGLSRAQQAELKEAFDMFDKNHDGRISASELGTVMRNIGQNPTKEEVKCMIDDADADGNGTIDFEEFVSLMMKRKRRSQGDGGGGDSLRALFNAFDKNGDGLISPQELQSMMSSLGENVTEKDVKSMIRQADTNRDGFIDFSEFQGLLKSLGM